MDTDDSTETEGPLDPEQKAALTRARERYAQLMRAARWAAINVWTVGVFGVLSVLWGLLSGGGGIVVGLLLVAVAWNEGRGRDRLRALDPEGPRILGWNQLVLGAVVVAYCVWTIVQASAAPDASLAELQELAGLDPGLIADLTALVYGTVAAIVGLVQAFLARYHFARGPMVEAFLRETPAWIVEIVAGDAASR